MKTFLICAYPRSRTFWLSQFLSMAGVSACSHEATEFAGSVAEFWSNGEKYAAGCDFYGNSDSANIYVLRALLADRPLTRVVWVDRPIEEVKISMANMGMPVTDHALGNLVEMRMLNQDCFDLVIQYRHLQFAQVCRELWEFCLPGVEFDYGRWGIFHNRRLGYSKDNPMPVKDFRKFMPWVRRELDAFREEEMMG